MMVVKFRDSREEPIAGALAMACPLGRSFIQSRRNLHGLRLAGQSSKGAGAFPPKSILFPLFSLAVRREFKDVPVQDEADKFADKDDVVSPLHRHRYEMLSPALFLGSRLGHDRFAGPQGL